MHRLNVRCCCQPHKILGTMDLRTLNRVQRFAFVTSFSYKYETIELRDFVDYRNGTKEMELAVYSDDRPIEFWRKFKGFIEAQADMVVAA